MRNVHIRAPRFSQFSGGRGYVTADTVEIIYAGQKLKSWQYPRLFDDVAHIINTTGDGRAAADTVRDYFEEA